MASEVLKNTQEVLENIQLNFEDKLLYAVFVDKR